MSAFSVAIGGITDIGQNGQNGANDPISDIATPHKPFEFPRCGRVM
jgi:hypothetical protein